MATTGVVRAVCTGWVVSGSVPGPDVDEFAEADRVAATLARPDAAGDSLLAVQHPHRTPAALRAGRSVTECIPSAKAMLDRLRRNAYREVSDVVAPYRVTGPDGAAVGLLCLADPAKIGADGQTWVRHSERVYPGVVAERAAVLAGLGCATSAAMLVPVHDGAELTEALGTAITALGAAAVTAADSGGRSHELWLLGPGSARDDLLALAGRHPLLVADGNHRVAAAAASDPSGLLALVTAGPDLRIGAIHRALVGTGRTAPDLAAAWRRAGLTVTEAETHSGTTELVPGRIEVRTPAGTLLVDLPPPGPTDPRPRIDHGLVERLLIADALDIDPAGPHLRALPDGTPPGAGTDAVLRIAAVPFAAVLALHEQGRRMPRKATYFTPKPRSGLFLAALD